MGLLVTSYCKQLYDCFDYLVVFYNYTLLLMTRRAGSWKERAEWVDTIRQQIEIISDFTPVDFTVRKSNSVM